MDASQTINMQTPILLTALPIVALQRQLNRYVSSAGGDPYAK